MISANPISLMTMKKVFRKSIVPVVGALLISIFSVVTPSAFAATNTFNCNGTDGTGGQYSVVDGTLDNLFGCTGPVVLNSDVTTLLNNTIPYSVTSIYIPASVVNIPFFASGLIGGLNVTEFVVSPDNPVLTSRDGVLYLKDESFLLNYPGGKSDLDFTIPDTTRSVAWGSLNTLSHLQTLHVGPNLTFGLEGGLQTTYFSTLQNIVVDPTNPSYSSIEGVLYNAAASNLLFYPIKKVGASFEVPATVTDISNFAIYATNLVHLILPSNLVSVGDYAVALNPNLVDISDLPASLTLGQWSFSNNRALTAINVDPQHFVGSGQPQIPTISSIDGVLFSGDGHTLITYPDGKSEHSYRIPDGVQTVAMQWTRAEALWSLTIPSSVIHYEDDSSNTLLREVTFEDSSHFAFSGIWASPSSSFPSGILVNDCNGLNASNDVLSFEQITQARVVCESSAPIFTLSRSEISLAVGSNLYESGAYQINWIVPAAWYSISPDPTSLGLSLNSRTGVLYGNPRSIAGRAQYTLTAHNHFGESSQTIFIEVFEPIPGSFEMHGGFFPSTGDVGGGTIVTLPIYGNDSSAFSDITVGGTPVNRLDEASCYVIGLPDSSSTVNPQNGYCISGDGANLYFVAPQGEPGATDIGFKYYGGNQTFHNAFTYTQNPFTAAPCTESGKVAEWNFGYLYTQNTETSVVGNSTCGNVNLSIFNANGFQDGPSLSLTPDGLAFDENNWLASYGKVPEALLGANTPYTIAVWVKNPAGGLFGMGSIAIPGENNNVGYFRGIPNVFTNYWCPSNGCVQFADDGGNPDAIRLLVATYNGTTRSLYIDGELVDSQLITPTQSIPSGLPNFSQGGMQIGSSLLGGAQAGSIKDLALFNVALNETEVANLQPSYPQIPPVGIISPTPGSILNGAVDAAFSSSIAHVGGRFPLTFTAIGSLPDGLTLNSLTGVISGTPTAAGSYLVSLSVAGAFDESSTVDIATVDNVTFVIAPAAPQNDAVTVPWATPAQSASVESISLGCDATASPIILKGSFDLNIVNIEINGKLIERKQWVQTATTLTITPVEGTSGELSIQIYNGASPLMKVQKISYAASCAAPAAVVTPAPAVVETPAAVVTPAPVVTPEPTPTPIPTPTTVVKKPVSKTIVCVKGKSTKTVKGTNPKCPRGYSLKKK